MKVPISVIETCKKNSQIYKYDLFSQNVASTWDIVIHIKIS